ncbi:erythromycin esterase family protein [Cellulophaga baltica]|uniref:erythromycin esterase family protein n=1 Tax=Cellulophaga baltica TaxID=76594 RepID=UPI000422A5CC|nr:erythromycin esterase family protein [Cellulophaga baltica]
MKRLVLQLLLFSLTAIFAQVDKNIYELNATGNLLTGDVKEIIDRNLNDKKIVFLGESNHYFGSDLKAKTEFVKYLVLEKGYKDIAFEADFFGLYFDHNNNIEENLYPFWSRSIQGEELFIFLKKHKVTIWGFDNQMTSGFSRENFPIKLTKFLNDNAINVDESFIELIEVFVKNRSHANKLMGSSKLHMLVNELSIILKNEKVIENNLWFHFLESFRSDVIMNSTDNASQKATIIRDKQMAQNLDFIVKTMPEKKFVVWLHNSHMIKDNYGTHSGQTMGFQFVKANPNSSYHIAFSSIHMPYRKPKWIQKSSNNNENILHFLPTTEKNYFIDSRQVIREYPEYLEKEYEGMFIVENRKIKTNWFKHYDALVFISKGEDVKLIE